MSQLHILVTGASGYIGGSVLSDLIATQGGPRNHVISALVRRHEQAQILASHGINPILFESLDDSELLIRLASENDIIINTANSLHTQSSKDFILGLAERQKKTGKQTHFIHTSGISNLGDRPVSGTFISNHIFSDKENIYAWEEEQEKIETYDQRTTDIAVVKAGLETGVKTYIIMAPTIYGIGTGFFNQLSIQGPAIIRQSVASGYAEVIGEGSGLWSNIHIADLVPLYRVILEKVVDGKDIPNGEHGIYFAETGEHSWLQFSQGIAKAGVELGALKSLDVRQIDLEVAADKWAKHRFDVELGFASGSRSRAELGRELGWKPSGTGKELEKGLLAEFKAILAEKN